MIVGFIAMAAGGATIILGDTTESMPTVICGVAGVILGMLSIGLAIATPICGGPDLTEAARVALCM